MAATKSSESDQSDFRAKLAMLDLDESLVGERSLEVPEGQSVRLEMSASSPVRPIILKTQDIGQLRRWIGTPERIAGKRARSPAQAILQGRDCASNDEDGETTRTPSAKAYARAQKGGKAGAITARGPMLSDLSAVGADRLTESVRAVQGKKGGRLSAAETDTIRAAARTLVHGDYASAVEYKPAVEGYFKEFLVAAWLFRKILVKRNSALILGTGVHNLTAYELEIEEGGRVVSYGHLTVRVTQLRHTAFVVRWPVHVIDDFSVLRAFN